MVRLAALASLFLICETSLIVAFSLQSLSAPHLVWQEQAITVNGITELWRLEWRQQPKPFCPADDELTATCPCMGFAYGNIGPMDLVRLRGGVEVERLSLGQFFPEYGNAAVIPGHEARLSDDDKLLKHQFPALRAELNTRPLVKILNFADYDHDGQATEFYIQTEAQSCGHRSGIVIGVSKASPRFHAFGAALDPNKPLHLEPFEWDALKAANPTGWIKDTGCGDHASEVQIEVRLEATPSGLRKTTREYDCPGGRRGQLIKESAQ